MSRDMYFLSMPSRTASTSDRHSRPKAVLFDLDGTLIDSIELILASMRYAFAKCERRAPSDIDWLAGVGTPLRTMFEQYAADEAALDQFIAAYREHQFANHDQLVRSYEEVPETIVELARLGHPLAVVTSKTELLARRGLEHVGILQHFDTIIGCDSTNRHKPHPEPVLTALRRLGYEPHEAVFVGDSVHDVAAGNAAGVLTIAALWGPFSREQLAESAPGEFLERIGGLPQLLTGR
jgi:pyrophosphatase PpaX